MKFQKKLIYILILLVVADASTNIRIVGVESEFFTPVSLAAKFLTLYYLISFAKKSNWQDDLNKSVAILFKIILFWNITTIIRGALNAHSYWDWKFLFSTSGLFFLIPLAFFIGKSSSLARGTLKYALNYLFLFGFIAIPLAFVTNRELYSRLMIPISFFVVMIPYLKARHKILVIIVAITSILVVVDFRTNILKIAISFSILLTWYFRKHVPPLWLRIGQIVIFFAPLILLFLAISGQFSIFKEASQNESYKVQGDKYNTKDKESLTADTRTFLYVEVFKTLNNQNNWMFGAGGVGKYKSEYFDNAATGDERFGSEVGFLNTLLYSGIVGVLLYALLLFVVSYNAIYYSNNWLSKMLGLVIISRWLLFFLEEFTQFDLNFYFLWVMIGLLSSKQFREMTDAQVFNYLSNFKRKSVNIADRIKLNV
jgi:hypothetical protein